MKEYIAGYAYKYFIEGFAYRDIDEKPIECSEAGIIFLQAEHSEPVDVITALETEYGAFNKDKNPADYFSVESLSFESISDPVMSVKGNNSIDPTVFEGASIVIPLKSKGDTPDREAIKKFYEKIKPLFY